ncbi:hypothetical protein PspS04_16160 [Pseudomonas sp. S04]|nr:hypothetical protein PspS04_16160 [Pseudomonas sp. S04]QHF36604.1 hypothetical protein PspS19_16165 [Pseudomonas sp. S19]
MNTCRKRQTPESTTANRSTVLGLAKQLGHQDWTMIAKVYGRWMPSADVGAGGQPRHFQRVLPGFCQPPF